MIASGRPDRIRIAFDDHRLVANAGLLLPLTLAQRLGLGELVDSHLDLGDTPGRANAGDKVLTLVASALAGGDCIDDADALRCGGTGRVLGCTVKAPHSGDIPATPRSARLTDWTRRERSATTTAVSGAIIRLSPSLPQQEMC